MNRRLHRRNRRVPFEERYNPPQHPRIAVDRVVALTPGSAITILKTANEFAIKGSSNSDTDKIMARMDAMTMKMDTHNSSQTKQLNIEVRTERMIFHIDSAMKHSYSNDDTCFNIDVIGEILEEDFDDLLDEGSEILHSIEGTILEEKLFAEFDKFMAMTADGNSESKSDTREPPFKKITFNTGYKIKTSLEEPPTDLELKPLPDNLEYVLLEEPSFLSEEKKQVGIRS
ncbi:hypothetical protein Tco_1221068 [Tanacetum coccineum]